MAAKIVPLSVYSDAVPIQKGKEKLLELGLEISKENLEKHISSADINNMLQSMRTNLAKPRMEQSKAAFDQADNKRNCLVDYMLDPDLSKYFFTDLHSKELVEAKSAR